jgi:ActR/RegA family two-component response regulator
LNEKILIADAERLIRQSLEKRLGEEGYEVISADTGRAAISLVEEDVPELVILDLKLPDLNGIEVLKRLREIDKNLTVLIITAYGSIDTAIAAIRSGAYDYLTEPFDLETILLSVRKALEASNLKREVAYFRTQTNVRSACNGLWAKAQSWGRFGKRSARSPGAKPPRSYWRERAEQEKTWWPAPFTRKATGPATPSGRFTVPLSTRRSSKANSLAMSAGLCEGEEIEVEHLPPGMFSPLSAQAEEVSPFKLPPPGDFSCRRRERFDSPGLGAERWKPGAGRKAPGNQPGCSPLPDEKTQSFLTLRSFPLGFTSFLFWNLFICPYSR